MTLVESKLGNGPMPAAADLYARGFEGFWGGGGEVK